MLNIKVFNYQINEFQAETLIPNENQREWIIGRASNCDLILSAPEVSRIHSRIGYEEGQYYFNDLGSTDGSRINQEVALINQKYVLKKDDIIRIGDFVLAIQDIDTSYSATSSDQISTAIPNSTWTQEELTVKCIRIIQETEDVKTFSFVAEPAVLFSYQPGQFVTLNLEIEGKPVNRSYSISSTPSRPYTLEITVKRVPPPADGPDIPPGLVSNWLHDRLKVGDSIKLSGGPMGKFTHVNNPNQKLLLISAGSGVTPMISMSRWIYDTVGQEDVVFFFCGRHRSDIIMERELQLIAARNPNFQLVISLTKPEPGQAWMGYRGRLSEQMVMSMVPDFRDRAIYVCGPDGFMKSVKTLLMEMGLPKENYHEESFGVGKKQAKAAKVTTPSQPTPSLKIEPSTANNPTQIAIAFVESGKTISCDGEESILEVAQQEGINMRSGCLQGVCGVCKTRKQKGEIRYEAEPNGLEQNDGEQGFILPCVAYPLNEVEIVA
jgi:glycine betaine catabolism B